MSHVYSPFQADYLQRTFTTDATPDTAAALATSPIRGRRVGFKADSANSASIKLRPADSSGDDYYLVLSPGDDYWIQGAQDTVFDIASWVFESSAAEQVLHALIQG